jgi:hypothetical protein
MLEMLQNLMLLACSCCLVGGPCVACSYRVLPLPHRAGSANTHASALLILSQDVVHAHSHAPTLASSLGSSLTKWNSPLCSSRAMRSWPLLPRLLRTSRKMMLTAVVRSSCSTTSEPM